VAKLIVWDVDRESATKRMLRALGEYRIEPLTTLIPFHQAILATEEWANASTCRELIADREWLKSLAPESSAPAQEGDEEGQATERTYKVEVDGRLHEVKVIGAAAPAAAQANPGLKAPPRRERRKGGGGGGASG